MSEPEKVYAIGYEAAAGKFDMIAGPTPNLSDMLSHWPSDFDRVAYILELCDRPGSKEPPSEKILFKYNARRSEWERIARENDFADPMLAKYYEVVLRSREELVEVFGEGELNLQERFFNAEPPLRADDQVQFACSYHNRKLSRIYVDRIRFQDEDKLRRDLDWVKFALEEAYKFGWLDGLAAKLSKPERPAAAPTQQELPLGGGTNKTIRRVR